MVTRFVVKSNIKSVIIWRVICKKEGGVIGFVRDLGLVNEYKNFENVL